MLLNTSSKFSISVSFILEFDFDSYFLIFCWDLCSHIKTKNYMNLLTAYIFKILNIFILDFLKFLFSKCKIWTAKVSFNQYYFFLKEPSFWLCTGYCEWYIINTLDSVIFSLNVIFLIAKLLAHRLVFILGGSRYVKIPVFPKPFLFSMSQSSEDLFRSGF